jgi:hypothetical protein
MSAVSDSVNRLTIEAGKYHGLTAGETIEKQEVVLQAEANGYSDREARAMLEGQGDTIEIPEQENLFGELWPDNQSNDLITPPDRTVVDSFRQWIDKKQKRNVEPRERDDRQMYPVWHNPEHNWSHYKARQNFAKAKDVDRHFWNSYDEFTTVLITRTADENDATLVEQTEALTPKSYYQSRYRLLKRLSDDYAACSVYAPKYPTHAERTVRTHVHTGIWLPGRVEPEAFDLLKDKHMATVEGATECHVSVEHHSADTYPPVENGIDSDRGATTALPYELAGENQPLMNVETDASDLYDSLALEWCATLSAGDDNTHGTAGMGYWKELGSFGEYAEAVADSRQDSDELITHPENTVGPNQSHELDEPKPTSHGISQDARDSLIRGISQLAQVPVPDRRLETPDIDSLRASMRVVRGSANSRFSESQPGFIF